MNERAVEPDTKDWTWVIETPCDECGFTPAASGAGVQTLLDALPGTVAVWDAVLARPDARERRVPGVWSDLEYGCHVRDVTHVFEARFSRMLDEDAPEFENWDQDVAAVDGRYVEDDPAVVAHEYDLGTQKLAGTLTRVGDGDSGRRGVRSNGSEFTVDTLAIYCLHDLTHHVHDVQG